MTFTEKDVKRISLIILIVILGVLVYLIIKPVIMSVIGGLILAYAFYPVYKWTLKYVKYETLSAIIITLVVLAIIILPIWLLAPTMIQKVFFLFQKSQSLNIEGAVSNLLPAGSEQLASQLSIAANNALSKLTSLILNGFTDFLLDFAVISLHLLLVAFVFFFALKDEPKLKEFVSGLSPLNKKQETGLINQFKDITNSIIYGQIIIGFIQGVLTGLGLWLFGVPYALLLTAIAVILGIIPVIGPGLVYLPTTVYLIIITNPFLAIGYLLYNVLIVSTAENIVRTHMVSRKTQLSQVLVLIGMVGGLLIFGVLGLILGPLILAYFLTFLKAYKEKTLSSLFAP
ncbi:MAG: AI-2E family transporter [archaeon]